MCLLRKEWVKAVKDETRLLGVKIGLRQYTAMMIAMQRTVLEVENSAHFGVLGGSF